MSVKSPGAGAKRVRLSPAERREQLIALGVRMLREKALHDISVGDIAEQAGISRGLLFHYFPTLQEFQLAVVRHANAEMLARTTPDHTLALPDMLRDAVCRYIDYVSDNRTSYLALLRGPASADPELAALVDATRGAVADRVLAEAPIALDDTELPLLRLAVRGWIAFVEETTLSWLRTAAITRAQLIDLLVDALPALARNPELTAALRG
ncbi:TetR/AcrR family transcriptional regulator [Nocardia sp. alder85J]|uniref:TetR/AcrR family transcriptional regulator n=1 Tax=Nocardia sp. alder85J TaxID=2862949 RepID=UPI001CD2A221|nr:TetR/AcrR family transcriptional regulator [Nocardia sp. alder85J]MCX4095999.1 TetR/AcrR family transcriptional regulator [Nocardia sp. alder85J]